MSLQSYLMFWFWYYSTRLFFHLSKLYIWTINKWKSTYFVIVHHNKSNNWLNNLFHAKTKVKSDDLKKHKQHFETFISFMKIFQNNTDHKRCHTLPYIIVFIVKTFCDWKHTLYLPIEILLLLFFLLFTI